MKKFYISSFFLLFTLFGYGQTAHLVLNGAGSKLVVNSNTQLVLHNVHLQNNTGINGIETAETSIVSISGSQNNSINGISSIEQLNINGNKTINAGVNNRLDIKSKLLVNNGNLITNNNLRLLSTASKTALISGSGNGEVVGNTTVQRYITGGNGYRYLTSPHINSSLNQWAPYVNGIDNHVFIPDTPQPIPFPTCYYYDETNLSSDPRVGWISYTNPLNALSVATGYALVVPGNITLSLNGNVNNNLVQKNFITNTNTNSPNDGFNLVGNPYPSPINWNSLRSLPSNSGWLSQVVAYWSNSGTYTGQYASYNGVVGINGGSNIIASSQGFMIKNIDLNSTHILTFDNSIRTEDLNPTFFDSELIPYLLKLNLIGNHGQDELAIYFSEDATNNYDELIDAQKLLSATSGKPNFYSIVENLKLGINAFKKLDQDVVIPLGIELNGIGNYSINVGIMNEFDETSVIYLEDRELGVFQNLIENQTYSFVAFENNIENRFYIHISAPLKFTTNIDCNEINNSLSIENKSSNNWTCQFFSSSNAPLSDVKTLEPNDVFIFQSINYGTYILKMQNHLGFQVSKNYEFYSINPSNPIFNHNLSDEIEANSDAYIRLENFQEYDDVYWYVNEILYKENSEYFEFEFINTGIHKIKVIMVKNGCVKQEIFTVNVVTETLSIEEQMNNSILVFPNPSKDIVNFVSNVDDFDSIEITDLTGKVLRKYKIEKTKTLSLDTSDFSNGIYIASLKSLKKMFKVKFAVNK